MSNGTDLANEVTSLRGELVATQEERDGWIRMYAGLVDTICRYAEDLNLPDHDEGTAHVVWQMSEEITRLRAQVQRVEALLPAWGHDARLGNGYGAACENHAGDLRDALDGGA